MGADLKRMIEDVIVREGGYVNHPSDRGGPTKYGVTQATLSDFLGRPASVAEVREMTQETAAAIYYANYMVKPGINLLPSGIQPYVFDAAVHSGPKRAIQWLQQAYGLVDDGVIGPKTITETHNLDDETEKQVIVDMLAKRLAFLADLVLKGKGQQAFAAGWMRRIAGLLEQVF